MVQPYQEKSGRDFAPEPKEGGRGGFMDLFTPAPAPDSELRRYRLLSPTAGVRVSPICLGAMSVGDQWRKFMAGELGPESAEEYLDYFYNAGGNFIDCANNYQDEQSEMIVGDWMEKRGNRNDIVLATKFTTFYKNRFDQPWTKDRIGVNYNGNHKKSLKHSLDDSLKKLKTDYIDLLYVHWWDHSTSIPELMQSLGEVVRSGKVLYLGVSDTPAWVVSQANEYARAHALPQFVVYQGLYNYGVRDMERDIIPMCRNNGLSIAPWGVLGQGKFKTAEELAKKGLRGGATGQSEADKKICDALEEVAKEIGGDVKLAHVALAWARQMYTACFPILGGTSIEYLKANIKALEVTLTDAQMEKLDKAAPFDHGFPTGRFGLDPRLLPNQTPNVPLLTMAGYVQYPKWP